MRVLLIAMPDTISALDAVMYITNYLPVTVPAP